MTTEASKRIDWDAVKSRLRESQLALEKTIDADPACVEAVYRQRAEQLAGRQTQALTPDAYLQVLVFLLGAERYALAFTDLKQILPHVGCTPVPTGPAELLGVVNVGGEIRSVLDLSRLLGLPAVETATSGYLLLVHFQGRETVLKVDGLDNSQRYSPEELVPMGDDGEAGSSSHYVTELGPNKVRVLSTQALMEHPVFCQREGRDKEEEARGDASRRE